jgi:hypothetical protein
MIIIGAEESGVDMRRTSVAVLVLAALLAGGLAACTKDAQSTAPPVSTPQATTPAPTTAPATVPPPDNSPPAPPAEPPHLGPTGYGAVRLGMTRAQAAATGLTAGTSKDLHGACGGPGDGRLRGAADPDGPSLEGRLFFSAMTGRLVAIYSVRGATTPEGVGLGSSYDKLHKAYPSWRGFGDEKNGRGGAPVKGNSNAHYRIVVQNSRVLQLSLDSSDQDCYE